MVKMESSNPRLARRLVKTKGLRENRICTPRLHALLACKNRTIAGHVDCSLTEHHQDALQPEEGQSGLFLKPECAV